MNYLAVFFALFVLIFSATESKSVYDITVKDHEGKEVSLQKYAGKVTLIVNVASYCGYTDSTYKALTRLHDILNYGDYFFVLAFPCNQFGEQEPDSTEHIVGAMQEQFGVEFPIFDKVDVTGPNASPLFKALIGQSSMVPDWNFYKYLVDGNGEVLNSWRTAIDVEEMFDDIDAAVKEAKKRGGEKKKEEEAVKEEEETQKEEEEEGKQKQKQKEEEEEEEGKQKVEL